MGFSDLKIQRSKTTIFLYRNKESYMQAYFNRKLHYFNLITFDDLALNLKMHVLTKL